jgi:hypothetical protein
VTSASAPGGPLGERFAAGREADVYALDDTRCCADGVAMRRRQRTLSAEAIGMLPAAAARVRGAN